MKQKDKKELTQIEKMDILVANANEALVSFMDMSQEQVDKICQAMALAGASENFPLAKMAVEETGRGVFEDKVIKNLFATEYIWNSIKKTQTVGITDENESDGFIEVAEPVGVVAAVTPVTNPTSTTMFKALICIKARNPVIFGFHPSAQKCSAESARVLRDAAIKAGAPENCIQWIEEPSIDATNALMNHEGVSLILATGGPGLVKAAYSCGKPALGVGAGNVPCYINKNVDIGRACTDLMLSKTFDNGMICASEQAAIVDKEIAPQFEKYMKDNNCYFLSKEEVAKVEAYVIKKSPEGKISVNAEPVGQSAYFIAEKAGIKVPEKTKILLARLPEPSLKYPISLETLMPLLAYFVVENAEQGFEYSKRMLELGGMGHTAVIHSSDKELCRKFGQEMKTGRVILNSPSSQGAIGDIYNTGIPSLTLGCGSYGKNSTTSNVSTVNLINKKRVSKRRNNMQWFKIPPRIYFEKGSIQYLEHMPNIKKAFIVTDPVMVELGYVDRALYHLRKRVDYVHSSVFKAVEPDPSVETVMKGAEAMKAFKPDVIIALGGGSAIDAAKAMWLFYEHPETDFESLHLKFLDIRKRAFKYPSLRQKAQFVAVPTTSGTGSEVTSFTVITDKANGNIKYPLADYELTPDVAIIDPQFVATMPASIVADTGLDVLTHALETYVSVLASDYTDGLAMKAIELIFNYLPRSFKDATDAIAREKVHNASCIAGMAFTNAFLGINHSLAHKLGGEFGLAHGRANALLLPFVIEYNSTKPEKFPIFPKYKEFIADTKYAEISNKLRLGGKDTQSEVKALIDAIWKLMKTLGMPTSIKECGIDEKEYMAKIPQLAERAFDDQCTTANPRYPLVKDLEEIYRRAYYGKDGQK
ncbi:MAG: bifunctional acetaldehyde-CoA/alcohol dehydrogenase [Firmicutes bacterium]|nr:bifunctional acetaldehyde-CoA/alcohol dehydrogenase [Bacillota bacterium]